MRIPPGFRFADNADAEELWNLVNRALNEGTSADEVDQALATGGHNTTVAELRQRLAGWRVRVTSTVSEEFLGGVTYYLCSRAP